MNNDYKYFIEGASLAISKFFEFCTFKELQELQFRFNSDNLINSFILISEVCEKVVKSPLTLSSSERDLLIYTYGHLNGLTHALTPVTKI